MLACKSQVGQEATVDVENRPQLVWRFEWSKKLEAYCKMSILKLFPAVIALALSGCSYPSNVVNDIIHMGDPTYDDCRRNTDANSDYGSRCAKEADPKVKAAKAEQMRQQDEQNRLAKAEKAEQIRQQEEQNRLAVEAAQKKLLAQQSAELAKGYIPITVQDFVLDGKKLATRNAKRSLTGVYMPSGNLELLFGTDVEAYQFSNGQNLNVSTVHLLTEDASRQFRSQLLACRNNPSVADFGCRVHVIGTVTMCALSGPLGNRREVPCVSVDDGSVGSP